MACDEPGADLLVLSCLVLSVLSPLQPLERDKVHAFHWRGWHFDIDPVNQALPVAVMAHTE